jgi:hypothetical protein
MLLGRNLLCFCLTLIHFWCLPGAEFLPSFSVCVETCLLRSTHTTILHRVRSLPIYTVTQSPNNNWIICCFTIRISFSSNSVDLYPYTSKYHLYVSRFNSSLNTIEFSIYLSSFQLLPIPNPLIDKSSLHPQRISLPLPFQYGSSVAYQQISIPKTRYQTILT